MFAKKSYAKKYADHSLFKCNGLVRLYISANILNTVYGVRCTVYGTLIRCTVFAGILESVEAFSRYIQAASRHLIVIT